MKKIFPIITFFLLASFLLPSLAQAVIVPCGRTGQTPCTLCHLIVGIKGLINYGTGILIIVALTAIVIAGVIYIASAGSQKMMQQAKSFMLSAVLGCVFFLGAWLIITVTLRIIGANNATSWSTFEKCDTTSSAPTSTTPPTSIPPATTPPTTTNGSGASGSF